MLTLQAGSFPALRVGAMQVPAAVALKTHLQCVSGGWMQTGRMLAAVLLRLMFLLMDGCSAARNISSAGPADFLHLCCLFCTAQFEKWVDVLKPPHHVDVITGPLPSR
jgi:hypothetical protein